MTDAANKTAIREMTITGADVGAAILRQYANGVDHRSSAIVNAAAGYYTTLAARPEATPEQVAKDFIEEVTKMTVIMNEILAEAVAETGKSTAIH